MSYNDFEKISSSSYFMRFDFKDIKKKNSSYEKNNFLKRKKFSSQKNEDLLEERFSKKKSLKSYPKIIIEDVCC